MEQLGTPAENPAEDGVAGASLDKPPPLRSVHTNTFSEILAQFKVSIAVQVLNGVLCPETVNEGEKPISETYELDDFALLDVRAALTDVTPKH